MTARGGAPSVRVLARGAMRMWQRNATVGRKTVATSLTPRFLEAIAYLAIMGLGLGTYLHDGQRRRLRRLHRARGRGVNGDVRGGHRDDLQLVRPHPRAPGGRGGGHDAALAGRRGRRRVPLGRHARGHLRRGLPDRDGRLRPGPSPWALLAPRGLPDRRADLRRARGWPTPRSSRTSSTSTSSSPGSSRRCSCSAACSSRSRTSRSGPRSSAGACRSRTWSPPRATSPWAALTC